MKQQLDLLLLNPGARSWMYGNLGSSLPGIEPPIWCAITAAFIRKHGYSVKIIDAEAANLNPEQTANRIVEFNPLLAGIVVLGSNPSASSTPKMTASGEVAAALKEKAPNIKVFFSGIHPSALPGRTLDEESADFICQGEAFYTICHLLEALKNHNKRNEDIPGLWYRQNGRVLSTPPAPLVDLEELPIAAWDLLPMDKYRAHNWHCFGDMRKRHPYAVIYTSLGCPFHCNYCNIHALYNGKPYIRFRRPEKAVEEIGFLVKNYHIRSLKIIDELFALREDRVNRICDLIIAGEYDINIWCYARVDTVNESMLRKMKKAGINWVCYGFESANEKVRHGVSKKTHEDVTRRAIEMTRGAGINIMANFIFGLPEDDLHTMQQTLDMAKEYNFEYVNFYTAMAYPGSQLYGEVIKRGIKLPEHWHGFGQYSEETMPLPTKYLSAAEVLRFRDYAFYDYLSNPRYLTMINEKFGPETVEHIKGISKYKIQRKLTRSHVE